MSKHTPKPWRVGDNRSSIVADVPVPGIRGSDEVEFYGGHLICESVSPINLDLISAAPDLLEAATEARKFLRSIGYHTGGLDAVIEKAINENTSPSPRPDSSPEGR